MRFGGDLLHAELSLFNGSLRIIDEFMDAHEAYRRAGSDTPFLSVFIVRACGADETRKLKSFKLADHSSRLLHSHQTHHGRIINLTSLISLHGFKQEGINAAVRRRLRLFRSALRFYDVFTTAVGCGMVVVSFKLLPRTAHIERQIFPANAMMPPNRRICVP